jgi:hypothetical protein
MADSGFHDAGFVGRAWRCIQSIGEGTKFRTKNDRYACNIRGLTVFFKIMAPFGPFGQSIRSISVRLGAGRPVAKPAAVVWRGAKDTASDLVERATVAATIR